MQIDPEFKVIPVRALGNQATQRFAETQVDVIGRYRRGEISHGEAALEIEHFWAGALRRAVVDGDVESGSLMAGQSVGMVKKIEPVGDILNELVEQAAVALGRDAALDPRRPGDGMMQLPVKVSTPMTPSDPRSGELTSARRLLRRLVQVMAAPVSAQERLDRMVGMIAADMVAEVCSVYVLRGGDFLELFATEGLRPTAVHQTRLRVGEGLVGVIAAHGSVVNLSEARSHPDFAYRPETGEDAYHAFLGMPIVHGGQVAGVLVVQNRTQRHYADEEVEALQIVATVFAEMLASGGLIDATGLPTLIGPSSSPNASRGGAWSRVSLWATPCCISCGST